MIQRSRSLVFLLIILLICIGLYYYFVMNIRTGGSIAIQGDATCVSQTQAALKYLKDKTPKYFDFAEKYIGVITCLEQGSGIDVFEVPPRFRVGKATRDAGTEWYAGTIVHDACHVYLFRQYQKKHPFTTPPAEIWSGETAERKCIEIQTDALTQAGAPSWVFESLKNAADTKYWEGARWW